MMDDTAARCNKPKITHTATDDPLADSDEPLKYGKF